MGSGNRTWAVTVPIAALTFALLILAFGVIPSEFIGWFNKKFNEVNMRRFVRDPIVIVYHLVVIGGFVAYAVLYQKRQAARAKAKSEAETSESTGPESAYGRPVAKAGR